MAFQPVRQREEPRGRGREGLDFATDRPVALGQAYRCDDGILVKRGCRISMSVSFGLTPSAQAPEKVKSE